MIALLRLRGLENTPSSEGITPTLTACRPRNDQVDVVQGHYRIGSRHEPFAYDNELPPQAAELASFRIARHPVGNAEYLAFIDAGGYREVAARGGMLAGTGRAREWCSNPFHAYPDFRPFPDRRTSEDGFTYGHGVLRGGSLQTLGCLRRASYRFGIRPDVRELCSGLRLVYPPG
jgi:iron(II)-dependent oxidoreductase